ncbi:acyltransferase family protein [Hyphomonas sp.]|jgi:glucan biosynthesis protein C|uniref:acyltransferase family protein n=1 Tax=Hyphomonas sp. TaxID=87 RepID=UPI0039E5051A
MAAQQGAYGPPLLLAMFVIVPPESYYEILEVIQSCGVSPSPWLDNFYMKYVTASSNWCDSDGYLSTPTHNHMWFVAFLIIYLIALVPLLPLLRRAPKALSVLIKGPGLFLTPWFFLFITRVTLFPVFGENHDFRDDGDLHTLYFGTFLFGFAIAKHRPFFDACVRWRWVALGAMFVAWGALMTYYTAWSDGGTPPESMRNTFRGVRELQAWTAIVALIGFAHRNLRLSDGPVRRVLTEASFPVYLIHQTIIVVAAHYLGQAGLPVALEATLLIAITVSGCWLFYDIGRRIPFLRIWIGLPSRSKVPARPTDPSPRSHQPEASL